MRSNSRKFLRLIAMGVVLALAVAACGDAEDALGTVVYNPGDQIQIRALQSITGAAAPLGEDQVRGVRLAIEDFGQIHGFSVNLGTVEDDLCASAGGQTGANAIISQPNVLAVIGTTCSGSARAAQPILSGAGLVMFSGSNTAPDLTSDMKGNAGESFHAGYYRTAHNDLFQGAAVAKFVYDSLGKRRAAAIHDGDPYTQGLSDAFRTAFIALGGEVPLFTATNGQQGADQTALLTDVAAANVEVVFFPIFPQTGGPEIIQQKDDIAGLEDIIWFSADGLFTTDFLAITQTEGMYFSGPDLDFGANVSATGKNYTQMRDAYIAQFGENPPAAFHAHTYDATVLVLTGIREVGELKDGALHVGKQALRDWLEGVKDFDGLIGKLTCDEFGDCGSQRIQIAHHADGSVTDITQTPVVESFTRADLIDLITGGE